MIILILFGLTAGTMINIVFDSFNYIEGFKLMTNMLKGDSTSLAFNPLQFINSWSQQNTEGLPHLSIIIILVLVNIIKSTLQFKKLFFEQIFLLFFSSFLFFAFSVSSWAASSRYFVPAFFASIFAYMLLTPNPQTPVFQRIFFSTIFFIIIYFAPIIKPFKLIDVHPISGCLLDVGSAIGFFNEEVDYVTYSLGDKGQDAFALHYNTKVCSR